MPLLTLHLLRFANGCQTPSFLDQLKKADSSIQIVVSSKPRYMVVRPEKQDVTLLNKQWDLMLLLQTPNGTLPEALRSSIETEYKVFVGIPSKLLSSYPDRNEKLLRDASSVGFTGSLDKPKVPESSQNLELSPDLLRFMDELMKEHPGPVTMLNLLNFKKGGNGKESYYQYGQHFTEVAKKRGGDAKIVGNVVSPPSKDSNADVASADTWQEIAIVHYASIKHFCDMLAGEDYQAINEKFRLPALEDTLLMCTTEFGQSGKARL